MTGLLGPALRAEFLSVDGVKVRPLLLPFANVGRWYRNADAKPERNSKAFSYAIWFVAADMAEFTHMTTEVKRDRAANKELTALMLQSIDLVKIGDEQQERAHSLNGASTSSTGRFKVTFRTRNKQPAGGVFGLRTKLADNE
jgi:hypothetical protein